jgi:hypothetical protein
MNAEGGLIFFHVLFCCLPRRASVKASGRVAALLTAVNNA